MHQHNLASLAMCLPEATGRLFCTAAAAKLFTNPLNWLFLATKSVSLLTCSGVTSCISLISVKFSRFMTAISHCLMYRLLLRGRTKADIAHGKTSY